MTALSQEVSALLKKWFISGHLLRGIPVQKISFNSIEAIISVKIGPHSVIIHQMLLTV